MKITSIRRGNCIVHKAHGHWFVYYLPIRSNVYAGRRGRDLIDCIDFLRLL